MVVATAVVTRGSGRKKEGPRTFGLRTGEGRRRVPRIGEGVPRQSLRRRTPPNKPRSPVVKKLHVSARARTRQGGEGPSGRGISRWTFYDGDEGCWVRVATDHHGFSRSTEEHQHAHGVRTHARTLVPDGGGGESPKFGFSDTVSWRRAVTGAWFSGSPILSLCGGGLT
jgi:hypothetical protein